MYTIEFQKKRLPHVHILVWHSTKNKLPTPADIDLIISAKIPDKIIDLIGYETVTKFMIHGPCGLANPKSPCMSKVQCSKHFPNEFRTETSFDENGFAIYRRINDGRCPTKNGIDLDNRYVVPHYLQLIVRYQAHINVEWCNKSMLIKYLFKYINKGPDGIRAVIEDGCLTSNRNSKQECDETDEIKKKFRLRIFINA